MRENVASQCVRAYHTVLLVSVQSAVHVEVLQRDPAKSNSSPSDHVILHHKQNIQKKENNLRKTVFTSYMFHVFPKKVKFKSESFDSRFGC